MLSRGRKYLLSAAATSLAASLVLFGGPAVAKADPTTVAGAKAAIAQLEAEIGHMEEQYAEAKLTKEAAEQRSEALKADLASQQAKVDALHEQAAEFARASFQSGGVDTTTRLFTSGDPDSFLQQVTTVAKVDENINQVLQQYQAEQANLDDLKRASDAEASNAAQAIDEMTKLTAEAKEKAAAQAEVLARLSDGDRAELTDNGVATGASGASEATNATTRQAVAYALAQVGDAYVWGAEGPNAFDCSGLMVAAYRSAGVSITHSAIGLSGTGRSVSKSDLQPGDLIFWYSPVHHVGMYVRGGMMVHARNVNVGVVKQSVDSYIKAGAPYSGAVRIVG